MPHHMRRSEQLHMCSSLQNHAREMHSMRPRIQHGYGHFQPNPQPHALRICWRTDPLGFLFRTQTGGAPRNVCFTVVYAAFHKVMPLQEVPSRRAMQNLALVCQPQVIAQALGAGVQKW